jgi:predicted ABC-type ATPase
MEEDRLSQEKHDAILERIKKAKLKGASREKPGAIILAGQPGAGKSYAREMSRDHLKSGGGVVVIDPDDLRAYHPRYSKHAEADPRTSAEKVHHDASLWAKELRRAAVEQKMNIVVDGTLSNSERAAALCKNLKKNGYDVEVRALAVDRKTSLESISKRFDSAMERRRNGSPEIPRYVSEKFHDEAYKGMPVAIESLEKNKLPDRIRVIDREGNVLYRAGMNRAYSEKDNARAAIDKGRREMAMAHETRANQAARQKTGASVSRQGRSQAASSRSSQGKGR